MERIQKVIKVLIPLFLVSGGYYMMGDIVDFYYEKKLEVYISSIDKKAIVEDGNVEEYQKFVDSVRNDKRVAYNKSNYIDYSLVMAHRHDYAPANFDIYVALMSVFGEENTDSITRELALYYLNRGANSGDSLCLKEVAKRNREQDR